MTARISPERRKALAAQLEMSDAYLYQCLTGWRDMNPARAREIEGLTNKEITRQMLCQKTWRGIWPELASEHGDAPASPASASAEPARTA
jgi:DNA-binding transcriptional regulator YdaS (Cro superfamily)